MQKPVCVLGKYQIFRNLSFLSIFHFLFASDDLSCFSNRTRRIVHNPENYRITRFLMKKHKKEELVVCGIFYLFADNCVFHWISSPWRRIFGRENRDWSRRRSGRNREVHSKRTYFLSSTFVLCEREDAERFYCLFII